MTQDPSVPDLGVALAALMTELVEGPPGRAAFMLNQGDLGLLRSLDRISSNSATAPAPGGGPPLAQHVDHVRYSLSLMNRWGGGEANPFVGADWGASWTLKVESEEEWSALREELAREARSWIERLDALTATGEAKTLALDDMALRGVIASVAHLAYHLGAIRQIDRATCGPSNEES